MYRFREFYIPDRMMPGLRAYVDARVPTGDFLRACLENNLRNACGQADDENLANIPAYAAWLYNEAPGRCWGSKEKVDAWLAAGETVAQDDQSPETEEAN